MSDECNRDEPHLYNGDPRHQAPSQAIVLLGLVPSFFLRPVFRSLSYGTRKHPANTICRVFFICCSGTDRVLGPAYNQTPHQKSQLSKRVSEAQRESLADAFVFTHNCNSEAVQQHSLWSRSAPQVFVELTTPSPERVSQPRSLSNTFGVHRQSTSKPRVRCATRGFVVDPSDLVSRR